MAKKKATKKKATARKATTRKKTTTRATASRSKKKTTKKATKAKATTTATRRRVSSKAENPVPLTKVAEKVEKARTKHEVYRILAETTGLPKVDVKNVFEALTELINLDLSKKGPGVFNLVGMLKIVKQRKPATKARKGINPFTGEPTTFKAKPARNVVKLRALKTLKSLV